MNFESNKATRLGGEDGEVYRNRKSYFSINVQLVYDSELIIKNIVARWPGSAHDSTIFNKSRLRTRFEAGEFVLHNIASTMHEDIPPSPVGMNAEELNYLIQQGQIPAINLHQNFNYSLRNDLVRNYFANS